MATRSTTITVSWTSNYNGPHRVCWREAGLSPEPDYNCTTDTTHPNCGAGECSYDIPITVDDETCETVTYEGYIQPACEDESSSAKRVPFTVDFIPSPDCKRYQVICDSSGVDSIEIDNAGSGYNPASAPAVTISGDGTGATATAVVGDGEIISIAITSGGSGYTNGFYPATDLNGGSGTGATADVTISGGAVTDVVIVDGGSGYVDGEIVEPDQGVVGVPTVGAKLTVDSDLGNIIAINVTAAGGGYTSAPTVVINPPSPGTTALAHSVLAGCPELTIYDCSGSSVETIPSGNFQPGDDYYMCGDNISTVPDEFSIVLNGNCLCNCIEMELSNTGPGDTVDIKYIDCDGNVQTNSLAAGISAITVCMVEDSLYYVENGSAVFTQADNGACSA